MKKTAIIVLHYENDDLTNKCVQSIRDNTDWGSYTIIIVDNGSPVPYKSNEIVIRNESNKSVNGMNFGFYHALYKRCEDFDYIAYLDNDIICSNGWLNPLIKEMENNPRTGICTGKLWDKEKTCYRTVGMDLMGVLYKDYPKVRLPVIWVWGCCVLMRAEMMRMIGLHDTRYETLCSDSDYCIHAIDRGWQVVFVPESEVIHIGSQSYKDNYENDLKDKTRLIQKWYGIKFSALAKKFPLCLRGNYNINSSFNNVDLTVQQREEYEKTKSFSY